MSEAERKVEQALNQYIQRKAGCEKTWYQEWLPLVFPVRRNVRLTCYSGFDVDGRKMSEDSTGIRFLVHVSEQDSTGTICGRDSTELKQDARYFARQLQPVIQHTDVYDWIEVEYSTYVTKYRSMSYTICERSIRLAVADTATWVLAPLRTTTSAYRSRAINNWEEQE